MAKDKNYPFAYCDKNLKLKPDMRRWKARMTDGKVRTVTLTRKTKLPDVKDYEEVIKAIEERIEFNEAAFQKKQITGITYDNTRSVAIRDLEEAKHDRDVRKELSFIGQQVEFIGYEPDALDRDQEKAATQ